jgi:hypothetical protein
MDTHLKPFPFLHSVAQSRDFFITMSGTEQLRISLQGELMTPPSGRVLLPRRDYKRCSNSHDYVTLRSSAGRSLSPSSVENLRSLLITSLHAGQVTSIKWKEPMRLPSTSFAGGHPRLYVSGWCMCYLALGLQSPSIRHLPVLCPGDTLLSVIHCHY